jgi:hypothetical protein
MSQAGILSDDKGEKNHVTTEKTSTYFRWSESSGIIILTTHYFVNLHLFNTFYFNKYYTSSSTQKSHVLDKVPLS